MGDEIVVGRFEAWWDAINSGGKRLRIAGQLVAKIEIVQEHPSGAKAQ
jgi:hypothetical protein